MSILTPFFNLIKPAKTDPTAIAQINSNMDTIDTEMHRPPLTVNEIEPDPETRDIKITTVPLADNLTSDEAQINQGTYIIRTSGGEASIADGSAWLSDLRGNMVKTGYVAESLTMTVTPVAREEGEEPITATLDRDTFVEAVSESGTINLYFTTEWSENPETYGITVEGEPVAGDQITVVYVKENRGTITTATPSSYVSTGWNLYNHSAGYARVVNYSTEYGFMVEGTYTALKFAETLSGTQTDITPVDGYFTVPADGYVFVTGGNDTDTAIWMTWSDWTEEANGGTFEAYTQSVIDLSGVMVDFPGGLMRIGNTYDEINLNTLRAYSRIEKMTYTAENLAAVIASGVPYDTDNGYIYAVRAFPVTYTIELSGEYAVSDHGLEMFIGTTIPVTASSLYGNDLKGKLRRDVLTISQQTLTTAQKSQVKSNLGFANQTDLDALNSNFTDFRYRSLNNVDINSLYGVENAGFYYVGTGNTNGPGAYSSLIVISGGDSSYQLSVTADNRFKFRKRVGNPPSWSAWVDLGTYDAGTITKNASGITDENFHLNTEIISGTLIVVTGYIYITTAITNNTKIATVSIKPKTEVFQSVVSSNGKSGRFKLTANGEIFCESALEANSGYYSMTFVSNYV